MQKLASASQAKFCALAIAARHTDSATSKHTIAAAVLGVAQGNKTSSPRPRQTASA